LPLLPTFSASLSRIEQSVSDAELALTIATPPPRAVLLTTDCALLPETVQLTRA